MTRILVTGSSDGLGQMAARLLVANGHQVVLHARNHARAAHAIAQVPGAQTALVGDLSSIAETKALAASINELDPSMPSFTMPLSAIRSASASPQWMACPMSLP